jgi:hypothetical protein
MLGIGMGQKVSGFDINKNVNLTAVHAIGIFKLQKILFSPTLKTEVTQQKLIDE